MTIETQDQEFKYWAFISYSHADKKWGEWLHRKLERFKIHKTVRQSLNHEHKLPERLFPIFRDREELPSSADLGEIIHEALVQSRYLIVICSRNSARSVWVNEEVKAFKAMGREKRVLTLIVDGEPNAEASSELTHEECFPEAVRYRLNSHGLITDELVEPLAADVRPGMDSKNDAVLRLVAGITGIRFATLKRREQKLHFKRLISIISLLAITTATMSGLLYWALQEKHRATKHAKQAILNAKQAEARKHDAEEFVKVLANIFIKEKESFQNSYMSLPDETKLFLMAQTIRQNEYFPTFAYDSMKNFILAKMIETTGSMDASEKKYWKTNLALLNPDQEARLADILYTEKKKLHLLQEKYQEEIRQLDGRLNEENFYQTFSNSQEKNKEKLIEIDSWVTTNLNSYEKTIEYIKANSNHKKMLGLAKSKEKNIPLADLHKALSLYIYKDFADKNTRQKIGSIFLGGSGSLQPFFQKQTKKNRKIHLIKSVLNNLRIPQGLKNAYRKALDTLDDKKLDMLYKNITKLVGKIEKENSSPESIVSKCKKAYNALLGEDNFSLER